MNKITKNQEQKKQKNKSPNTFNQQVSKSTNYQLPSTQIQSNQHKMSIISVNLANSMPKKLKFKTIPKQDKYGQNNQEIQQSQDEDQQLGQSNNNKSRNNSERDQQSKKKDKRENQLRVQNKRLKNINKQLKHQLLVFEKKLDETIRKQALEHSEKKIKYKVGQQILENMQLRNAYKMCQIYKKQISYLKKKQASGKQSKVDELQNNIYLLQKQKQKLHQQVKDLKKINKQQQKGLREMSVPNSMKLFEQNEKLKQSIRRLQKMHDIKENQNKEGRKKKVGLSKRNVSQRGQQKDTENSQSFRRKSTKKNQQEHQNQQQSYKSSQKQKQKREFKQKDRLQRLRDKQIQDNDLQMQKLKNRILKDHKKLTNLLNENTKYREYIQELKNQLIDKDKQCSRLRQKISQLREQNNQLLSNHHPKSSARHKRVETQPELASSKPHKKSLRKATNQVNDRQQSLIQEKSFKSDERQSQQFNFFKKYPQILQSGYRIQNSYKWNHHHLSSKVKQIQIYPHTLGHIKQISFRYQKGEPNKPSGKYASFCCEENKKQWIKSIKGGYKNGMLRYLSVQSNKGRKANFCQFEISDQCINFQFKSNDKGEYLGAFFGQNINEGVCRLGCFLEIQK